MRAHIRRIAAPLGVCAAVMIAIPTTARAAALVADWMFENAGDLGYDSSGNGNNATTVTGVTQVSGPSAGSYAAAFNGTSSLFDVIGGLLGQTGTTGVSYSAWVMITGQNPQSAGVTAVITQDHASCCIQRLLVNNGRGEIDAGAHVDQTAVNATTSLNMWFNIALTEQVTGAHTLTASVYIDGILDGSFNETFGINSFVGINTYLGGQYLGTTQYYGLIGDLADVRIYDGALSSQQVATIYSDGADSTDLSGSNIPEPASLALFGAGVAGLVASRRRV